MRNENLTPEQRAKFFKSLTPDEAQALVYDWHFWSREKQMPPEGDWRIWLVLSGRGFGKTRMGSEWVRENVKKHQFVNIIGPTAADYRDVMVEGESGILRVCPSHERPEWLPSRRILKWPNGATTLCFSAEDPEQLRGPQHQKLWCDEIAAWKTQTREATWDLAMFGLRLGPSPQVVATTTPKPVPLLRSLVEDKSGQVIITKGTTWDNKDNLAPEFIQQLIKKYEGTRLGRQELEAELLLDEGLAYIFSERLHVVQPFDVPLHWNRFEGLDHGMANPTSWIAFATDEDGNHIVTHMYYSPGLVSEHAQAIHAKRKLSRGYEKFVRCYADPSIRTRFPKTIRGKEITVELEYADFGIEMNMGQNDRAAGYARIAELMKPDSEHPFPEWHQRAGELGSPRLFFFDKEEIVPLVEQIRDAPLEDPDSPLSRLPGEAVDMEWEGRHGHAHAAARYALMSRPSPNAPLENPPHPHSIAGVEQRNEWYKDRNNLWRRDKSKQALRRRYINI